MNTTFRIEVAEIAERELREIFAYIAKENLTAARNLMATFGKMAASLETFPTRCPLIPENDRLGKRFRHLIHGSYRMIFTVESNTVLILHLIHGARLLDPMDLEN